MRKRVKRMLRGEGRKKDDAKGKENNQDVERGGECGRREKKVCGRIRTNHTLVNIVTIYLSSRMVTKYSTLTHFLFVLLRI